MSLYHDDSEGLFTEFFDLWTADTTGDLHRVLDLYQQIRSSSDWFEPYQLLARHHKSEPAHLHGHYDIRAHDIAARMVRRFTA